MSFTQRLPADFYTRVQERLRAQMAEAGLDALLLDHPLDVAYVTGLFAFPSERPIVVYLTADDCQVLLPALEVEHAQRQQVAAHLISYPEFPGARSPFAILADHVAPPHTLGHASSTSVGRAEQITRTFTGAAVSSHDGCTHLRRTKTPEEVRLHTEAARIADRMIDAGVQMVRDRAHVGALPTEAELAEHVIGFGQQLMYAEHTDVVVVPMLTGGLVYAGANSALPHGLPSGYRLRPGDTFMLSLGCAVGGRFVESERTFVLRPPTEEQRRYYDAVQAAQHIGTESLQPGVPCRDANQRCLQVLREAGLSTHIRHRQGHGIGLGFHEPPWIEDGDDTVLEPGMIVSSEPGVYVAGHAGYRISDTVLITDNGPQRLTGYPRDLDEVTLLT